MLEHNNLHCMLLSDALCPRGFHIGIIFVAEAGNELLLRLKTAVLYYCPRDIGRKDNDTI